MVSRTELSTLLFYFPKPQNADEKQFNFKQESCLLVGEILLSHVMFGDDSSRKQ